MSHARRRVRRLFEVVSALAGAEIWVAAMVAARWKASVRDVSVNFARPTTATAVAVSARGANGAAKLRRWNVECILAANGGNANVTVNS